MVRIRLTRMGSKKRPFYRIVVANSTSPREGRAIDQIGYYDPLTDPATIKIDAQKAGDWLRKGAQPTESVSQLFRRSGLQEQIDAARTGAAAPAATATAE
ncbi:MAG: 30S ribosomal protein S16 [Armatimonadota bacterium]